MNIRQLTQFVLLAFVVVGLGVAVAQVVGRNATTNLTDAEQAIPNSLVSADEGPWVAYYFHAEHRCPTCQTIEAYAHEALQPQIEQGEIDWHVAEYTAPENRKLIDHLKVMTATVVLVQQADGQIIRFQNLEDDVWKLAGDRDKFLSFMRDAVQEFRKES